MYGVDEETVKTHTGNPILYASELISTEIPVILVAGDSDKTVPYSENGALLFWLGSSETRGAYSVDNEAVPEYLAKRQNATSVKRGVDGATVFFDDTITNDDNRTSTNSFVKRIESFGKDSKPDALVVCVSTNDAKEMYYEGKDCLGSVTGADKTALSDFDTSTTLVALETKWDVTVLDLYGDTEMNNVSETIICTTPFTCSAWAISNGGHLNLRLALKLFWNNRSKKTDYVAV